MEQIILSKEQIHEFQNQRSKLYHIINNLQPTLNPTIINELNHIHDFLINMTDAFDQAEEDAQEKEYEALEQIRIDNDFHTIWSMDIKSHQMNTLMPKKVKSIIYGQYNIPVNKMITWLEYWKIVDSIIDKHSNHIFIEDAEYKINGTVHLRTGS